MLKHDGEHVLISGTKVLGFYKDFKSALRAGLKKVGLKAFFIKQISPVEVPLLIARKMVPCRT